ncbi:MAG: 16S rRNA (guanine(966)-N(2))-methyltransferase RsmD [Planctomycetota bacterium]|nr:MAG: 16S rRNA (guanine(966)-N(2))-methyltransferase RsmD [Planctomycetota bacterium]
MPAVRGQGGVWVRIAKGRWRGRRLWTPRGKETRPVLTRVRSALMDVLAPRLEGARVLDLFAGSGALVFEALSRGAAHAVAVDRSAAAIAAIERNAQTLGAAEQIEPLRRDAFAALGSLEAAGRRFDLVLVPPPYWQGLQPRALEALDRADVLAPGALVVVQRDRKEGYVPPVLERLVHTDTRRWGNTVFEFHEPRAGERKP